VNEANNFKQKEQLKTVQ